MLYCFFASGLLHHITGLNQEEIGVTPEERPAPDLELELKLPTPPALPNRLCLSYVRCSTTVCSP
jgi:hypothetical protein